MSALVGVLAAVAGCDNPQAILTAVMARLHALAPHSARIVALHGDEHGRLHQGQMLADWRSGQNSAVDGAAPQPISDFPLVAAWEGRLAEPALFSDIESDERADDNARQAARSAGYRAAVLVPLYIESYGGWQGVLKLFWAQPRTFSAAEVQLYHGLMTALSMHLGGLASQQRLGTALSDLELLHHVSRQLNAAHTLDDVLRSLAMPVPAHADAEVVLCAIANDANGRPTWLTVINQCSPPGHPGQSQLGARYYLPEIPFAKLYLSSPDAPILISDVKTDPRVDDFSRSLYAQNGIRATIIMALTVQDRWVGLLNVSWQRPVELGEREQRIYQALARHAALRLDNSLMVERLRASLEETRQQGAVLRTVLDNIPVGIIFTEVPSGRALLSNPAAARLLGRKLDPETVKSQYVQAYRLVRPGTDQELTSEELAISKAISSGATEMAEVDVILPANDRNSLEVVAIPMRDGDGPIKNMVVMMADITSRKRAEEEQRRLQEEALRAQAATLAERSSPLIPITDDILVLPIIGSIDTERGHQVLDTVLSGASQSRARVAIIDITGVRTVDTQAAAALTGAAQALRLLGVIPVLTGIKAEVAQTLVGLGISLEGIVTRSTLQSGIQYALRQLGKTSIV